MFSSTSIEVLPVYEPERPPRYKIPQSSWRPSQNDNPIFPSDDENCSSRDCRGGHGRCSDHHELCRIYWSEEKNYPHKPSKDRLKCYEEAIDRDWRHATFWNHASSWKEASQARKSVQRSLLKQYVSRSTTDVRIVFSYCFDGKDAKLIVAALRSVEGKSCSNLEDVRCTVDARAEVMVKACDTLGGYLEICEALAMGQPIDSPSFKVTTTQVEKELYPAIVVEMAEDEAWRFPSSVQEKVKEGLPKYSFTLRKEAKGTKDRLSEGLEHGIERLRVN